MHWPGDDHSGYRVLENELFLVVGFQDHGILVETFYAAGQFDPAHQIDGEENLVLPRIVQKSLLYILC
jgi:hypothetical protein